MIIETRGGSIRQKELVSSIAQYSAEKLMPRLESKIMVTIRLIAGLKTREGIYGDCIWEDDDLYPREFTIRADSFMKQRPLLETIAHEMVHVKQYARDEMRQLTTKPVCRFNGAHYPNDLDYWDQPWEIEAHGREKGLFVRWAEANNITAKWAMEEY
jgi:hypothetical protein